MQSAAKSVPLAVQFYWFLGVNSEDEEVGAAYQRWQQELLTAVKGSSQVRAEDLNATQRFVEAFRDTEENAQGAQTPPEERKLALTAMFAGMVGGGNTIPLLTRPKERVDEVETMKAEVVESATRPVIVPCRCVSGRVHSVMYKKDDLQKDVLVMGAIRIMKVILLQAGIPAPMTTYSVLATSTTDGFIEIVKGSRTLYELQQEGPLLENLKECAKRNDTPLQAIQDRFMRSVAAYCVVTYLLGIGDRHLDNLMLAPTGELFHIDFSFVLGRDPKPLMPPMRLSKDMVDAMGGEMSIPYRDFKGVCEQIFLCLRRRPSFFATLLLALVPEAGSENVSEWEFSIDDLHREIVHRFMPGLSDPEAASEFQKRIADSAAFSLAEEMSDMFRHYRRQGVVGQVAEAGWSWLKPLASAVSLLASTASEAEANEYPGEAVRRVSTEDQRFRGVSESFMAAIGDPDAPPRLS